MVYYSIYLLFFFKIVGAPISREGGHVLSGQPLFWSVQSYRRIYIYYTLVCGQRRAARQQRYCFTADWLSQSVTNSQRDQSTPVVVEFGRSLAAGRYVVVANKLLTL